MKKTLTITFVLVLMFSMSSLLAGCALFGGEAPATEPAATEAPADPAATEDPASGTDAEAEQPEADTDTDAPEPDSDEAQPDEPAATPEPDQPDTEAGPDTEPVPTEEADQPDTSDSGATPLSFESGSNSLVVEASIEAQGIDRYELDGSAGKEVSVSVLSPEADVLLSIQASSGQVIHDISEASGNWSGTLLADDVYIISAVSVGESSSDYVLTVLAPASGEAGEASTGEEGQTSSAAHQDMMKQAIRIEFPLGGNSVSLDGYVSGGDVNLYILAGTAGEQLSVDVATAKGNLQLSLEGVDGQVLKRYEDGWASWSGTLPTTQDYLIGITPVGNTAANYTLTVTRGSSPLPPDVTRIEFPPGAESVVVDGSLDTGDMKHYVLYAMAGQDMSLNILSGSGQVVIMAIRGADGTILTDHHGLPYWSGKLPASQDYFIDIINNAGWLESYSMQVTIPPIPVPTPGPGPDVIRIQFPPGADTAVVDGSIDPANPGPYGPMRFYVLSAMAGQTMAVDITSGSGQVVIMAIRGADGTILTDHHGLPSWSGTLPSSQDYFIDIISNAASADSYSMRVTIPPQPGPSPTPGAAKRIQFPPGGITAVEYGSLSAGGSQLYVLGAQGGQTMSVDTSSAMADVIMIIWGADGTVLLSDHAGATSFVGVLPSTQDYFIEARYVGSSSTNYSLMVTIPPLPGPTPSPEVKRIQFPPGGITAVEYGTVSAGGIAHYVLQAGAGQVMSVNASSPANDVIIIIWGADGTVLQSDHVGSSSFSGPLPSTQDYFIDVKSIGASSSNYSLTVTIPPA